MADKTELPDEHEQLAAAEAFFDSLDDDTGETDSADALALGSEALVEALEQGEEEETPAETPEMPETASEEVEEESEETPEDETLTDEAPEEDSWEKRYKDQQSFHDRQMAEMRGQLDQLNTWAQNVYQQQVLQAQQAQQSAQQTVNPLAGLNPNSPQLKEAVEGDLVNTFRAVAQHRPDLVASTIAQAREIHGHTVGDQMQLEYNQHLMAQQQQAYQQQLEQIRTAEAEREAPAQIQAQMASIVNDIATEYGDSFKAVENEFVARAQETAPAFKEYMESRGLDMSPDAIHYFLTKTFNDIREENINKNAAKPRKPRKVAASEHVETSAAGSGNGDDELTADEVAINEILEGARESGIDIAAPNR